jgi:hypothetical protein
LEERRFERRVKILLFEQGFSPWMTTTLFFSSFYEQPLVLPQLMQR